MHNSSRAACRGAYKFYRCAAARAQMSGTNTGRDFLLANGVRIHAVVEGSPDADRTVVLLHGFPDSSKLWSRQVRHGTYDNMTHHARLINPLAHRGLGQNACTPCRLAVGERCCTGAPRLQRGSAICRAAHPLWMEKPYDQSKQVLALVAKD